MDIGDLFAGLNALDAVRVTRNPDGTYAGLISDSEVVPVTDVLNHNAEHATIGLPEQIIAAIFSAVFPLPALLSPAENASGVSLTPTLTSKEGVAKPYVLGSRITADQTLIGTDTDLIFNSVSDTDIPLNTATGVFTLKAGVEYEMTACPNLTAFTNTGGYIFFRWVFAADNTPLPTSQSGSMYPAKNTAGEASQPVAKATYRPVVDTDVKVRTWQSGTGTCSMAVANSWASVQTTATRYLDYTTGHSHFQVKRLSDNVTIYDSDVQPGLTAQVSPPLASGAQLAYRARHEDDSSGHWTGWTSWRSFSTL